LVKTLLQFNDKSAAAAAAAAGVIICFENWPVKVSLTLCTQLVNKVATSRWA